MTAPLTKVRPRGERKCLCVRTHSPKPLQIDGHHIHPQEWGGPTEPSNLVWLCPTAHTSVHVALRALVRYGGMPPAGSLEWRQMRGINHYALTIARKGFAMIQDHPTVTLEGIRAIMAESASH